MAYVSDDLDFQSERSRRLKEQQLEKLQEEARLKQQEEARLKEQEEARLKQQRIKSISQGCRDFQETRVHKLKTTYLPDTDLLVFYAAGTPGGTCRGSVTTVEVATNEYGPWTRIGEYENIYRSRRDDTIHTLRLHSLIEFSYVRITTPVCYTDCSGLTVGWSEDESKNMINFPRRWE
jgi:hypothetical protein